MPFVAEARLLQELGERLVASPEVALLELVKNARDADAEYCEVRLVSGQPPRGPEIVVWDTGEGMHQQDFLDRWMRIATQAKRHPATPRFRRPVTGQKGIGRFAVRFLGHALRLESVKLDPSTGTKTRLIAVFDWRRLDRRAALTDALVPYRLLEEPPDTPNGTTLTIRRLRIAPQSLDNRVFLTRLLQIVSPTPSLDAGRFSGDLATSDRAIPDPGFSVKLVGFANLPAEETDIAGQVLDKAWARLRIDLDAAQLSYSLHFRDERRPALFETAYPNAIGAGLHADIAFFPRRRGMFEGLPLDGRLCWSWVRENHGVGVIDHGFRIKPYGFEDDDWLHLGIDHAHNRRDWRSSIASSHFPITEPEKTQPGLSPALNLPTDFQVVGAVFVSSPPAGMRSDTDLIPSMDREGFLENQAFLQLHDIVRGGLEFLATADKQRILKAQEREARAATAALREDLRGAVTYIQRSSTLSREEKAGLSKQYAGIASRLEEQEDYDAKARQQLEIAAGLGVVAGFMTHESDRLLAGLVRALVQIEPLASRDPRIAQALSTIRESRTHLEGYISYTRLYVDSMRLEAPKAFKVAPQVDLVVDRFGSVARRRGIETDLQIAPDVMAPALPIALYSAVLLNLYSNAIKAVIARKADTRHPRVAILAWNDDKKHHIKVCDTGIGIPPQLRKRVWDPFFTTTSSLNSPLGTGMGLGLPLVRDLVARAKGKVEFVDPPPGFNTCAHVSLPREQHD